MLTEPVSVIPCDALERRAINYSLRQAFADILVRAVPKSNPPSASAHEVEATTYRTFAEGLIHSRERSDKPKSDQAIAIVKTEAWTKIRMSIDRLKSLRSSLLIKDSAAGARLPDAVLESNLPRVSAQEFEATYRTLAEGLIHSRTRSDKSKSDHAITTINTDAWTKIRLSFAGLKNLSALASVRALAARARLVAYKRVAEGLIHFRERELSRQRLIIIDTGALTKIRIPFDRLKNLRSPSFVKALAAARAPSCSH